MKPACEMYKEWSGSTRLENSVKEVHDSNEAIDFANHCNSEVIDYIENEAEIAIPVHLLFNKDGTHKTKKEYGRILLKYLSKEIKEKLELK